MPAIVTSNFRLQNAKMFINSFNVPEWGGFNYPGGISYIYLFVGKPIGWDQTHSGYSDSVVPTPDGDIQGNSYEPWRDMIALDLVANTDIHLGAVRTNWTSGTVYDKYDDQDPGIAKGEKAFFVYTSAGAVFKCLDNAGGAESSAEPTVPSVVEEIVKTSDEYRWKYMYSIPNADATKFLSTNYIPVRTLNSYSEIDTPPSGWGDLSTIQSQANAGTIEAYSVTSGGSGFTAHSGGVLDASRVVGSNDDTTYTTVTLTSDTIIDGKAADFYKGSVFVAYTSAAIQHISVISSSDTGSPPILTLEDAIPKTVGALDGITYHIGPRLEVTGDGSGANIYSFMTSAGAGAIARIGVVDSGNTYTTANVTAILPDNGDGNIDAVNIRPIIAPPGGHGSDPSAELNGWNVIVSKTLAGNLASNPTTGLENLWPVGNEYRTIGLVRNPILYDGYSQPSIDTPGTDGANWYANTTPLHQTHWITCNTTSGTPWNSATPWTPAQDDIAVGLTSSAQGRVVEYNAHSNGRLVLSNITTNTSGGTFMFNEQIALYGSESTAYLAANGYVLNASDVQIPHDGTTTVNNNPELIPSTGDILYIEHRTPITRSSDQSEDIKIVVEF